MKLAAILSLLLLCSGCTTMIKSDKIVAIKTRWFGIRIVASSTTSSELPEIGLGWGSVVFQMLPTSTNQLYSANYFDTFNLGQSANPFSTSIIETTGVGNVEIGTNSSSTIFPEKGTNNLHKMGGPIKLGK